MNKAHVGEVTKKKSGKRRLLKRVGTDYQEKKSTQGPRGKRSYEEKKPEYN